jgi:outer membrane lipoprotein SlyB
MTYPMRGRSLLAALVFVVAGCATTPGADVAGTGQVMSIRETQQTSSGAQVVGTLGGAIAGALLGSQIGGGSGQIIAGTVGSVGGAMAGSAIANHAGAETVWDITVRFDDGIDRTIRVRERPAVRPGDRVNVSNGVVTRL